MLAVVLLTILPIIIWASQAILLARSGLPIRLRIGYADLPTAAKRVHRAVTNVTLLAVLVAYPLLRGCSPLDYYAGLLPAGRRPLEMAHGFAGAVLYLALLYLAWLASGNVRFRVRHTPGRLAKRLAGIPLTAFLVAFLEELLFRGVLLAGLLELCPSPLAVGISVVAFANAHYLRTVKRYWTYPGHLGLGLVLCVAFVCTRSLWLSMGIHTGGVLILMGVRPFVRYTGPAWLIGASIFPYAGIAGVAGLVMLTINIWLSYGGM